MRICLPLFLTSAVNSARKWWYTLLPVSANIEIECFLLFDQETKSQFVCDAACPDWLMSVWNDATSNPWLLSRWNKEEIQRKTHINALEVLAIVAVVWARRVSHLSQTQRDNCSVERMSDPQTNATSICLLGTPQLFLHISWQSFYSAAGGSCIKQARRKGS